MAYGRIVGVLLIASGLIGCSHSASLKKSFARAHQCNARDVSMVPWGSGYVLEGCGARELCESSRGPCGPDVEALMVRARATWAAMRSCPEIEIQVAQVAEGIAVNGCGGYGVCPGSATNCFAAIPPSCQDMARSRYEQCVGSANRMGARGRSGSYYPYNSAAAATEIARGVTSSIVETNRSQACQDTYQMEVQGCR